MFKKLTLIAVAVIMLLAVVGLAACEDTTNCGIYTPLSLELELQIKQDYLLAVRGAQGDITIEDVNLGYYGTYNGWIVVTLESFIGGMPTLGIINIAGFIFEIPNRLRTLVWQDGQFYDWKIAYDQGILSRHDIRKIHCRFTNRFNNV